MSRKLLGLGGFLRVSRVCDPLRGVFFLWCQSKSILTSNIILYYRVAPKKDPLSTGTSPIQEDHLQDSKTSMSYYVTMPSNQVEIELKLELLL